VLADAMDRIVAFGPDALDEDLVHGQEAEALPEVFLFQFCLGRLCFM
jgi:hypothetical protein